jgi:hypothetical protein
MFSCRSGKKTVRANMADSLARQELNKNSMKGPRTLSQLMQKSEFQYEYLSSKFTADVTMDGQSNSFNVNVRAKKDSILWMSFSLLGIEGARMIATVDSVKFIDRINHKFFFGDYNYISQLVNTEVDFELMQSVLIGNSVEFYDEDEKLKSSIDTSYHLLSTIRRKRIRRLLNKSPENVNFKELVQRIWIVPQNYKIAHIVINDFNSSRTFQADYSDFQMVDSLLFPFKATFLIAAQKNIRVLINYSKVLREKPQSFSFSIPAGYDKIR